MNAHAWDFCALGLPRPGLSSAPYKTIWWLPTTLRGQCELVLDVATGPCDPTLAASALISGCSPTCKPGSHLLAGVRPHPRAFALASPAAHGAVERRGLPRRCPCFLLPQPASPGAAPLWGPTSCPCCHPACQSQLLVGAGPVGPSPLPFAAVSVLAVGEVPGPVPTGSPITSLI